MMQVKDGWYAEHLAHQQALAADAEERRYYYGKSKAESAMIAGICFLLCMALIFGWGMWQIFTMLFN
jgi:hypothetical protein